MVFKKGQIVKSAHRTAEYPIFAIVTDNSKLLTFGGTIIYCSEMEGEDNSEGLHNAAWKVSLFEESSWKELNHWISKEQNRQLDILDMPFDQRVEAILKLEVERDIREDLDILLVDISKDFDYKKKFVVELIEKDIKVKINS